MLDLKDLMLVGVDLESFYSTEYSLRRMSVPLYVRDRQWLCFGGAVKIKSGPSAWLPHEDLETFCKCLDWSRVALYGHNMQFDGFALAEHYGVNPALYVDTLAIARALIGGRTKQKSLDKLGEYLGFGGKLEGGKALGDLRGVREPSPEQTVNLAKYACRDIDLTFEILKKLSPLFPKGEWAVADWVTRMMTEPVLELDEAVLEKIHAEEVARKEKLVEDLDLERVDLNSNQRFAEMLIFEGVDPPKKLSKTVSKKTGKREITFAFSKTDQEFVELQESGNERVAALVRGRLGVKSSIEETRALAFLQLARTGKNVPVPLNYSGAMQTHRLGGAARINWQNVGRKSPIRKAIKAPDGHVIVTADSAQGELRVAAMLAGQWEILDALKEGRDVYGEFGTDLFKCPVSKEVNEDKRFISKIGVLSLQYQSGAPRFQHAVWTETNKVGTPIKLSDEESWRVVDFYRERYPEFPALWDTAKDNLCIMARGKVPPNFPTEPPLIWRADRVIGPSGLAVKYPNIRWHVFQELDEDGVVVKEESAIIYTNRAAKEADEAGRVKIYGGKTVENLSQFLLAEIIRHQTMEVNARYPVKLQVHDSLGIVVPEQQADHAAQFLKDSMSKSPPWWPDIPLDAEVHVGRVYGETKKWQPK